MNFSELGLKPELVTAVTEKGYTEPTPIQLAAIPAVLGGRDVLAGAQTGTGKTAGFVLPILQRLGTRGTGAPRALILTPTRELAAQVAESVRHYGKHTNLRSAVIFGVSILMGGTGGPRLSEPKYFSTSARTCAGSMSPTMAMLALLGA